MGIATAYNSSAQVDSGDGQIVEPATAAIDGAGNASVNVDMKGYTISDSTGDLTLNDAIVCGGDVDLDTNTVKLVLDDGDEHNPAIVFGDDDDGVSPPGWYSHTPDGWRLSAGNHAAILEMSSSGSRLAYSSSRIHIVAGAIQVANAYLYNNLAVLNLGNSAATGHSLLTGAVIIGVDGSGNSLEVDGVSHFDALIHAYEGVQDKLGTALPATCTQGISFLDTDSDDCADTGGGDGALCYCKTTNTWALVQNI
jgi:hypothetical protein